MKFYSEPVVQAGPGKRRGRRVGFTLVELLVVMAIIIILATLASLALKSLSGSTSLDGAADGVGALFASARQEAISKNTVTAVVIDTDYKNTSLDAAYRTLGIWDWVPGSGTWAQASKWRTLPTGIVVDNTALVPSSTAAATIANPLTTSTAFTYQGVGLLTTSSPPGYAIFMFLPSGRLTTTAANVTTTAASTVYTLKLVQGFYSATGVLTYTSPVITINSLPDHNNVTYYFSTATGEAKAVRP